MSWDVDLVMMLRTEIGDFDSIAYTDNRLREVLAYAAYSVNQRATFKNIYTIDVDTLSVSPDPYDGKDYDFCVLTVYKAACTILTGEMRLAAKYGVKIKDGPSSFDNTAGLGNSKDLMKSMCDTYEYLLLTYQVSGGSDGGGGPGQAILSPYSPGGFLTTWNRLDRRGNTLW